MVTAFVSHRLTIVLCAFLIYSSSSSVHSLKQEVFLFEIPQDPTNVNYSTPYMPFTENTRNVTSAIGSSNARGKVNATAGAYGACTNGTWMVYSEPNYKNGTPSLLTALNPPNKPQCVNMSGTPIQSIRHPGHSDMDMPALSLYDNATMAAGRELYFEGYMLTLPSPMSFGAYGFTGPLNWTVSDELNGTVITDGSKNTWCLELPAHNETELTATGGNILTYKQNASLTVREIRAGCGGIGQQIRPDYNITPFILPNSTKPWVDAMNMSMHSSGIKLFVRINATTIESMTVIGTKLRLIKPLSLINYTFTGPAQDWTIYSDVYATAGRRCLVFGSSDNGSAAAEEITVGALDIGCAKAGASSASVYQFTGTILLALFAYVLLK